MALGIALVYSIGGILRYCLMKSSLQSTIASRVEVSTPLNAWLRVKEGCFLQDKGVSVYSGGIYHGSPLELLFTSYLIKNLEHYLPLVFILCDLMTAYLLSKVSSVYCKMLLNLQEREKKDYAKESLDLLLTNSNMEARINYVSVAYLFCPYTVVACVGQTTTVFANFLLTVSFLVMLKRWTVLFGFMIALSTYLSFYPICLLVPGILAMKDHALKIVFTFIVSLVSLLAVSSQISGGWDYLEATYGFILSAPDLTPNIGLFWYFFTEMFEHFRLFFLATFQINIFVYVLPLAVKLRHDSMLLSMALLSLMTVFKSYPCLGDVGFYLSLLPMWYYLDPYLRQIFLVGCMLFATSVLGPIMYNLWIFNGSANANFYFAITLVFNTAQIFLVTDFLFANKKRRYHLFNGPAVNSEGEPADLSLE